MARSAAIMPRDNAPCDAAFPNLRRMLRLSYVADCGRLSFATISSASAMALVRAMLATGDGPLRAALDADSSLAQWARASFHRVHSRPPQSIDELAAWTAAHAHELIAARDPSCDESQPHADGDSDAGAILFALADRLARLDADKVDALAEFAAGAGHEMNNPLAVISGRVQLLLRDETDPERRRALALINAQAMRVHEMIADLMLFARPPALRRETCDATALVREVVDRFQSRAEETGATVRGVGLEQPRPIDADPVQLTVALNALVENSLHAAPAGLIEIEVQPRNATSLAISVRDTGPGLTDEDRRHLFDPFYSGRPAGRGLGVGLSKAHRIVAAHGGRIEVDAPKEGGARFTIVLPLAA